MDPSRYRALALVLVVGALQGCHAGHEPPVATDATPLVTVVKAEVRPLMSSLTVTGALAPRRVALVHAQAAGLVVTELLVEEGQTVRAGQVLARLSSERQRAELAGARGGLHGAEQALSRAGALAPAGAMTHSEADQTTALHAEALARVRVLEVDLARTEVRAPVGGLLQRRHVEIGTVVEGAALFEIAAEGALELVADVSEAGWAQTRVGQSAEITLADGRAVAGSIRRLSGALDGETRLGRAWISLDAAPPGLVAGSGASARLRTGSADLLSIPQSSLLFDDAGPYVFVVVEGTSRRRPVTLGVQNAEHAEILAGVQAGDSLVARAGSLLRDGDPTRIAEGNLR